MYILDNYSLTTKMTNSEITVIGKLEIHDTANGEAKEISFAEVSSASWDLKDLGEAANYFQILQKSLFFFHLDTPMSEPKRLHIYCPSQDCYVEMTGFFSII